jgi:hypothetical protein
MTVWVSVRGDRLGVRKRALEWVWWGKSMRWGKRGQ